MPTDPVRRRAHRHDRSDRTVRGEESAVRRGVAAVGLAAVALIHLLDLPASWRRPHLGLPGAMDDLGNWLEPLGLASLFVEGVVAVVALGGLARRR